VASVGGVDEQPAHVGQVAAGPGRRPHHDLEHLLILEQAADLEARKQRGRGSPDVPWLQSVALGLGEIDLDRHVGLLHLALEVDALDAVDGAQNAPYPRRRRTENRGVRAEDTDKDRIARFGQNSPDALLLVGLHVPDEARVAVDRAAHCGERSPTVGLVVHGHPEPGWVDVDSLVAEHSAPDLAGDAPNLGKRP
jgi:hypothetical protein